MSTEHSAESDARTFTSAEIIQMFDLHVEVLRANRRLDAAFPPYTGEQFAAIRDRAEQLRDRAEALRALFDPRVTPTAATEVDQ